MSGATGEGAPAPAPNPSPDDLARLVAAPGPAAIPWTDARNPARPLVLNTYRGAGYRPGEGAVVVVQHGQGRNGAEYRDAWAPAADRHGLLVVAPTFPEASWPGPNAYNNGLSREASAAVAAAAGTGDPAPLAPALRPREDWGYGVPARALAALREAGVVAGGHKPYLFGHSGGGQFVHRLLSAMPPELGTGLYAEAAAANPGWYTLPTLAAPFPDGLGGLGLGEADLARLLAYPLTVLAGDRDTDPHMESLPRHASAMAQGPHRFARAHHYVERGRAEARRLGVPCDWRLVVAPGVAHEGFRMAAAAAALWFEGRAPGVPGAPGAVSRVAATDGEGAPRGR